MSVGIVVDYGGLTFNSGVADANGTQWYVDKIDGWDSPSMRSNNNDPTTRNGTVITRTLLGQRSMVLGGLVKSTTGAAHWNAWYGLDRYFNNLSKSKHLTVTEDLDRWVGAVRVGEVRKELQGNWAFKFEVNLMCPDPLKYGATTTVTITPGSTATLANVGSFPTENITLTANTHQKTKVKNNDTGGNGLLCDEAVSSGTTFDFLHRDIEDSLGNDLYSCLAPQSEWFALQPGDNHVVNNGPGSVTIAYRPAWL